jgi:hypothetical protein
MKMEAAMCDSKCQHAWRKNGKTKGGTQRYYCRLCGALTQDASAVGKGRPRKYQNSKDRYQRSNRKKMYTYTFEKYHSYTSFTGLSFEEEKAIAHSGNYNNFPECAIVDGEEFGLQFYNWSRTPDRVTPSGYAYFGGYFGSLKVKVETISISPNYNKERGDGDVHQRMIVRSDRPLQFR